MRDPFQCQRKVRIYTSTLHPQKDLKARLGTAAGVEPRLRLWSPWKPLSSGPVDRVLSPSPPPIGAGLTSGRGLAFVHAPSRERADVTPDAAALTPAVASPPTPRELGSPRGGVASPKPGLPQPLSLLSRPGAARRVRAVVMDLNLNRVDYLQVTPKGRGGRRAGGAPSLRIRSFRPGAGAEAKWELGAPARPPSRAPLSPASRTPPARPQGQHQRPFIEHLVYFESFTCVNI